MTAVKPAMIAVAAVAILTAVGLPMFHSLCNRSTGGDCAHQWSNTGTVVSINRESQSFVMTVGEGAADVLPFDLVMVHYANANRFEDQIERQADLVQLAEGDEVEVRFFPSFDAEIEADEVYDVDEGAGDADE